MVVFIADGGNRKLPLPREGSILGMRTLLLISFLFSFLFQLSFLGSFFLLVTLDVENSLLSYLFL